MLPSNQSDMGNNNPSHTSPFNKSKLHHFPWNGHNLPHSLKSVFLASIWHEIRGIIVGSASTFLFPLSVRLWFGSPLCAAFIFSAPLVWFGHIWHSCGLVNSFLQLSASGDPPAHFLSWIRQPMHTMMYVCTPTVYSGFRECAGVLV